MHLRKYIEFGVLGDSCRIYSGFYFSLVSVCNFTFITTKLRLRFFIFFFVRMRYCASDMLIDKNIHHAVLERDFCLFVFSSFLINEF